MNPQWNTPPDGDFARYVEQLAARSMQTRHELADSHRLDAGSMAPVPGQRAIAIPRDLATIWAGIRAAFELKTRALSGARTAPWQQALETAARDSRSQQPAVKP